MKMILSLVGVLFVSGCAHQTIHEYCTANVSHYLNYEQCYAECSTSGNCISTGRKLGKAFFQGMAGAGAALSSGTTRPVPQNRSTNCTGQTIGNQTYINCN